MPKRKFKKLILVILIFLCNFIFTAQCQFYKCYNKVGNDNFATIQFLDSIYVVGGSSLSTNNNTTTANLLLIDETGNIKIAKEINSNKGEAIRKLIITKDKNIVCAGYTNNTQSNYNNFFIAKFDLSLNMQWIKYFGKNSNAWPFDVIETQDSGLVIVGLRDYSSSTTNLSAIKIKSNGDLLWQSSFGSLFTEWGNTICELSNGNLLIGGWSDASNQSAGLDNLLMLLDAQGNLIQTKFFISSYDEGIYHIIELPNKNLLCSGGMHIATNNQENFFLLEIDSNLNSQRAFKYQLPNINTRAVQTLLRSDSTYITMVQTSDANTNNICIANISKNGNILWSNTYPSQMQTYAGGIVLANGKVACAGSRIDNAINQHESLLINLDSMGNTPNFCFQQSINYIKTPYQFDSIISSINTIAPINFDTIILASANDNYLTTNLCSSQIPVTNLASSDTIFCDKQAVNFYDLSANNPTSWLWFFSGASPSISTAQHPTNVYYASAGNFDVTLIACNSGGCDTLTFTQFIKHIAPIPAPTISTQGDTLVCSPAHSYQWFGVGSSVVLSTDSFFVLPDTGQYYVLISDSNGCNAASAVYASLPHASYMATDTSVCVPGTISFADSSTGLVNSWFWIFSGGAPSFSTAQQPPAVSYTNPGMYEVTLIVCNNTGCDTLSQLQYITVHATPVVPLLTYSNDTLYAPAGYSYQWYNTTDSNTVLGTANYFYTSDTANYFVVITDSNGCSASSNLVSTAMSELYESFEMLYIDKQLHIRSSAFSNFYLYNTLGKCVLSRNVLGWDTIATQHVPSGIYIATIYFPQANKRVTRKILIE